ncbi:beta-propeller domain-containing protein [Paenibacillus sp. TRM 82003]|nr:beta-propeller domain-containing protein [Paenibacillus sp. TRM 82003]
MKGKWIVPLVVATMVFGIYMDGAKAPAPPAYANGAAAQRELPTVDSYERFVSLMQKLEKRKHKLNLWRELVVFESAAPAADTSSAGGAPAAPAISDFSGTNVQVAGVDEADRIKTDGAFIYQLQGERVVVTKAVPADQMGVVSTLTFDGRLTPIDLYVDGRTLSVIGRSQDKTTGYATTSFEVYALGDDRTDLRLLRSGDIRGEYLSSRKIGSDLYVVANRGLSDFRHYNAEGTQTEAYFAPMYRDSAAAAGDRVVAWDEVGYAPDFEEPNYLMIAGLNVDAPDRPMAVTAFLGAGNTVYASPEHLYVSLPRYEEKGDYTAIYKFRWNAGAAEFAAEGKIEGRLLNQFALDEHDGHLRVATTTGEVWGPEERQSKNHLFVLDEKLQPVGAIRDIAPGERIYSTRFLGERGYMVTFKKVDPLFVFDLSDPASPTILGKLKIPGYSDYLHPYDENHIIGFGKDTVEAEYGDFALYQGMKMALFDITDVADPKEKFVEIIGDRGTDSELLRNHKALLFSKEKNVLAFPVAVVERNSEREDAYGEPTFQGAYVYRLDLEEGFTRDAEITHLSEGDRLKMGHTFDAATAVQRALFIGDALYTVSDRKIAAHRIGDYAMLGEVDVTARE